jgi:glycine cleavage system H protein
MRNFTKEHEWVTVAGDIATIGISDYAQNQLGDVVYVSLIKKIGDNVKKGDAVSEIESVKSVSEIYAPVDGTLSDFNKIFEDESRSGVVNKDPYNEGWIFKLKIKDNSQIASLMTEDQYKEYTSKL